MFLLLALMILGNNMKFRKAHSLVKLGTLYGQGTRTMAALADLTLTEAGLVMSGVFFFFIPIFALSFLI